MTEPPTAAAIEMGLEWLKKHQDADGRWDGAGFMKHDPPGAPCTGAGFATHDIGLTGLALLAFLGDGSTSSRGAYRDVITRAAAWLIAQQQDNGRFGTGLPHDFIYDHAIATWAMCETHGLGSERRLAPSAQNGINYLEAHRNPYMVWRYAPRDNDNDTSVTAWCVMAYRAAVDFKLVVNKEAFNLAAIWLDNVTDPNTGRVGYAKRGQPSSRYEPAELRQLYPPDLNEALTAAGLSCRFLLEQNADITLSMRTAADLVLAKLPRWVAPHRSLTDGKLSGGSIDVYAWYHAAHALHQFGGPHWDEYAKALTQALVTNQRQDASYKGSWDPENDVWGMHAGRVYMTAMAVLALESHYRFIRPPRRER